MSIDWENRPEGATHYREGIRYPWMRMQEGMVQFFHEVCSEWRDYHDQAIGNDVLSRAVERPKPEWSGDGLPPVGTVCEVLNNTLDRTEWERCTILFMGKFKAVYESESCHERVADISESWMIGFRPLRTPEQIAAEEALRDIELLYSEGGPAAVYAAGYRKVEGGAQ